MSNMTQHLPNASGALSLWQRLRDFFNLNDPQWGRPGNQQNDEQGKGGSAPNGENDPEHERKPDERRKDEQQPGQDKKPPEGPPDLDEIWSDLSGKLGGLFGSGQGSSNPNDDNRRSQGGWGGGSQGGGSGRRSNRSPVNISGKGAGTGFSIVIALLLAGWFASGIYIVQEGQEAVVLTFGRGTGEPVRAGLHWRWPAPIQTHEIVDKTRMRTIEIGNAIVNNITGLTNASMLTQDKNILDIRFTVQYSINDSKDYLFNNAQLEDAVTLAAESAVREVVGSTKMEAAIVRKTNVGMLGHQTASAEPVAVTTATNAENIAASEIVPAVVGNADVSEVLAALGDGNAENEENLQSLAVPIRESIQNQLSTLNTGIQILAVNILDVQVPDKVKPAFDDARSATAERESLINEGKAYANQRIASAVGVVARISQDAQAYTTSIVSQANGDAQRFTQIYEQYRRAPRVTRDRMYLETMQEIYGNVTKIMVDAQNNSLLYVPLDRLLNQGGSIRGDSATTNDLMTSGSAGGSESGSAAATAATQSSNAAQNPASANTSTSGRSPRESFSRGRF